MDNRPSSVDYGGHTCPNCGAWVAWGTTHNCGQTPQVVGVGYSIIPDNTFYLQQIISLLEKILEKLEK